MQIHRQRLLLISLFLLWPAGPESRCQTQGETPGETARVEVQLTWTAETAPPGGPVKVTLWRDGFAGSKREVEVEIPGDFDVELPPSRWRIAVADQDLFAESVAGISLAESRERSPARIELEVIPASRITARLRAPDSDALPLSPRLHFRTSPAGELPERSNLQGKDRTEERGGESTCSVEERGRLECKAPRGVFDLRLDFPEFAPVYRWDQILSQEMDLGEISLKPGASLSGWILAPETGSDLALTRVSLEDIVADESAVGEPRPIFRQPHAKVGDSGFFQLTGLRPGLFVIEATHPGYAPTRIGSVALHAGEETVLEPLELQPPASLDLVIEPETDPFHRRWRLALRATEGGGKHAAPKLEWSGDGRWRADVLAPGHYRVEVFDGRGNRWISDSLALYAGENLHELHAPLERLEGLLLMDEEPLPEAKVTLEEHQGNMRVTAQTDGDGRFFVFLKEDLRWNIDVYHRSRKVHSRFEEVEVPPRDPAQRWPKKTFEIPQTMLYGDVFYPDGTKVEDPTIIQITSTDRDPGISLSALKPLDGFEVRGLPAGSYRISASIDASTTKKRGESRPMEVLLTEDTETGPLHLELEQGQEFQGQVLAANGTPVPAARVFAELESTAGDWLTLSLPSTTSDAGGIFELNLPQAAQGLLLTVLAPGHPYHQERLRLATENPSIVIVLGTGQGLVHLDYADSDPERAAEIRRRTFLLHDAPMRSGLLALWSQMHQGADGGPGTLPAMPAGTYRACVRTPEAQHYLGSLAPLPAAWIEEFCSDAGYLPVGGALELSVPSLSPRP